MILLIVYTLLLTIAIAGLVLIGIINRQKMLEYQYKDAIRQLRVVAISRGTRSGR